MKPVDLDFECLSKEQLRRHPYYKFICAYNKQCMTKRELIWELENVAITRPEAVDPRCRVGLQNRMWYPRVKDTHVRTYATARPPMECHTVKMSDRAMCKMNTHQLIRLLRQQMGA
jgi:hypothetical protein